MDTKKYYIEGVELEGVEKTNRSLVDRVVRDFPVGEMTILELADHITRLQNRLNELQILDGFDWTLQRGRLNPFARSRKLRIRIKEVSSRPHLKLAVLPSKSTDTGVGATIKIGSSIKNYFGFGESADVHVNIQQSSFTSLGRIEGDLSFVLPINPESKIQMTFEDDHRDLLDSCSFKIQSRGGRVEYTRKFPFSDLNDRRYSGREYKSVGSLSAFSLRRSIVIDDDSNASREVSKYKGRNSRYTGVSVGLSTDTRYSRSFPTNGYLTRVKAEIGSLQGGSVVAKLMGYAQKPFPSKFGVVNVSSSFGVSTYLGGAASTVSLEDRYFIGGSNNPDGYGNVRGIKDGTLGVLQRRMARELALVDGDLRVTPTESDREFDNGGCDAFVTGTVLYNTPPVEFSRFGHALKLSPQMHVSAALVKLEKQVQGAITLGFGVSTEIMNQRAEINANISLIGAPQSFTGHEKSFLRNPFSFQFGLLV